MRKINRMDVLKLILVLSLVAGAGLALGAVGRFTPTHKIVEPVFCVSCHPEQAAELTATTHLQHFAYEVDDRFGVINGINPETGKNWAMTDAEEITGACTMCHNFWDNMKWFGVNYMDISLYEHDVPGSLYDCEPATGRASGGKVPQYYGCDEYGNLGNNVTGLYVDTPKDIYGNVISNYGMGSTNAWVLKIGIVDPWRPGLDTYAYTDVGPDALPTTLDDQNWKRVDYLWSALSALSPGPVAFQEIDPGIDLAYGTADDVTAASCGTAEKGLCHIAVESVSLAAAGKKQEFSSTRDVGPDGIMGTADDIAGPGGTSGAGVFFNHEMAYTTAQYAAKPVKLCGACHVFKLPPMVWGGEAWANMDIKSASRLTDGKGGVGEVTPLFTELNVYSDPFGFRPAYDLTGEYHGLYGSGAAKEYFDIRYKTPDWAHQNVPCIRCHSHAGVTGETVSSNK